MDAFEKLFAHHREYRVIICKRCKYAVNPAQAKGHIQSKHRTISTTQCAQIVALIDRLSEIARSPEDVRYPDPVGAAVPGIPVYENGLRCTHVVEGQECNYTCREKRVMSRHCRQQHGWRNPRKNGRPDQWTDRTTMWVEGQSCQSFFQTGGWQKIFPIQVVPASGQPVEVDIVRKIGEWADQLKADLQKAQEEVRTSRSRYEANPWLEHTGWERHITDGCRGWVTEFVQATPHVPKIQRWLGEGFEGFDAQDEKALSRACEGTVVLIRRAFQASRIDIVGRHALHRINRREVGGTTNDRPFYGKQQVKTVRKYAHVFVKILRYVWRTADMAERPRYRLTSAQRQALTRLRDAAREGVADRDRREDIVRASSAWWIAVMDHELRDDEYESAVLSGLAVLGTCGEKDGWVPAVHFTPTLAAVITTMRAIVVRRAWRAHVDHIEEQVRNGRSREAAAWDAPVIHELVQQDIVQFMTMAEFGGRFGPMQTIYTQKMYGMKIRSTTNAPGQIAWTGANQDVVVVRKIQFSMDQMRSVVHGLVDTARRRLVQELLFMIPGVAQWRAEDMPRFDMARIVDNHSVGDEGYSFVHDARNAWPVDGWKWLVQRVFAEPVIRERFTEGADPPVFDADAVEAYLRQVRR